MEKIKNYFVHITHFYNSLEEIRYDILEFICLNVSAIRRFCTLTKEGCVTDTKKEVIKQLRDRNCKDAINKPGLWDWIRKNMPQKFLPLLAFGTCMSKIYKISAVFVSFKESLHLCLDLIYMIYDRLTLRRSISRT